MKSSTTYKLTGSVIQSSQRGKQWPLWNRQGSLLFTNNNKTKLALYKQSLQGIFTRLRAPLPERGLEIFTQYGVFMAKLGAMLYFSHTILSKVHLPK
jgi:hypothetical protein